MNIKRFNISKPKKYNSKEGVEKTQWNNIGTITEFHKEDGSVSRIIEIPAIGLEASIFPFEPRDGAPQSRPAQRSAPANEPPLETIEYPAEDVNPDDIPF